MDSVGEAGEKEERDGVGDDEGKKWDMPRTAPDGVDD